MDPKALVRPEHRWAAVLAYRKQHGSIETVGWTFIQDDSVHGLSVYCATWLRAYAIALANTGNPGVQVPPPPAPTARQKALAQHLVEQLGGLRGHHDQDSLAHLIARFDQDVA